MKKTMIYYPVCESGVLLLLLELLVAVGKVQADDSNSHDKNPYSKGCFHKKLGLPMRVCHSEDPPNAAEMGLCRKPPIEDYMEIRIFCQDWESVLLETWVLQLILSEIMDVPTTVETGFYDQTVNFYDPEGRYDYAYQRQLDVFHSNYQFSMVNAREIGDCRKAHGKSGPAEEYQECAHLVPEICSSLAYSAIQDYVYKGIFDPPKGLGALGIQSWFIPKFTAQRDPSLMSYIGLQGEQNRHRMAELFKTPITWKQYCDDISENHCGGNHASHQGGNGTAAAAQRAPQTPEEGGRYFVEGLYTGYFMDNDCSGNLTNACEGHIADFPCQFPSYVWEQTQYLNIALRSKGTQPGNKGYSLAEMDEIWRAGNATKNNVIMHWWNPQALYQLFHGTDAEFVQVTLPTPTEQCLKAREVASDRCSDNLYQNTNHTDITKGSCDTITSPLYKMRIANLPELTNPHSLPPALHSPAWEVYELFQISEYQLNEIFTRWKTIDSNDPHEAVCQWAVDNIDYMKSFIPNSYPRVMVKKTDGGGLHYVATGLAALVMVLVLGTAGMVHLHRTKRSVVLAQVDFLTLLLMGDLCISTAALVMVVSTADAACVAVQWIINLGYTLELVPTLVKVSAITRLALAAQKLKRHQAITRQSLFRTVCGISALIVVFMVVWTTLDPPRENQDYVLTDSTTEEGTTIVEVFEYCRSDFSFWYYISMGWMMILLLSATVLAVQMRKVQREELKESGTLATLVYFHFVFALIRFSTYFVVARESILIQLRSLIFSLDALSSVLFYVAPKFFTDPEDRPAMMHFLSRRTIPQGTTTDVSASFSNRPGISTRLSAASAQGEEKEEETEVVNAEAESLKAQLALKDRQIAAEVENLKAQLELKEQQIAAKESQIEEYKSRLEVQAKEDPTLASSS